jgi:hypothetical protein
MTSPSLRYEALRLQAELPKTRVLPCKVFHYTVSPCLNVWVTFLSLHDFLNANDLRWIQCDLAY